MNFIQYPKQEHFWDDFSDLSSGSSNEDVVKTDADRKKEEVTDLLLKIGVLKQEDLSSSKIYLDKSVDLLHKLTSLIKDSPEAMEAIEIRNKAYGLSVGTKNKNHESSVNSNNVVNSYSDETSSGCSSSNFDSSSSISIDCGIV